MIHDAAAEEVNLIWGVAFDESLDDEIRITVIATDFDHESGYSIPTTPAQAEQKVPAAAAPAPAPAAPAPAPQQPSPAPSLAEDLSALGEERPGEEPAQDAFNDPGDDIDLTDIIRMLNNR